jgi:hypothetical protein
MNIAQFSVNVLLLTIFIMKLWLSRHCLISSLMVINDSCLYIDLPFNTAVELAFSPDELPVIRIRTEMSDVLSIGKFLA